MQRYALGIEYIGTFYKGWQKQKKTDSTVQENVDIALSKIADETIKTTCSGRTDSGVHALMQVVHFETRAKRLNRSWVAGTNSILPKDINISWIKKVPQDFHARFSAIKRTYRYHVFNGSSQSVLNKNFTSLVKDSLNLNAMQEASKYLLGENDFSSFRGSGCQSNSPNRNIYDIKITKSKKIVSIEVSANAFLLNMVRIIVGTLIDIGMKKNKPEFIRDILASKNRNLAGKTAEAKGLFYLGPEYDHSFKLVRPKYKNNLVIKN